MFSKHLVLREFVLCYLAPVAGLFPQFFLEKAP